MSTDMATMEAVVSAPVFKTRTQEEEHLDAHALKDMKDSLETESRLIDTIKSGAEMSAWLKDYKIPDKATLEASYDESRAMAFQNAPLMDSQQHKRKARYMEKAKMQASAAGMVKAAYDERGLAMDAFLERMPRVKVAKGDVSFLQDWSTLYNTGEFAKGQLDRLGGLFSEDYSEQKREAGNMASEILHMDISGLEYKDDMDFLHKFKDNYKKLCAYSNVDMIIKVLDNGMPEERIIRLKARAKALKEIRDDYENKLQIMQSPYYALLLESDQEDMKYQQLKEEMKDNEAAKAYFEAVEKRKTLKYGKGMSASDLENEYLNEEPKIKEIREKKELDEKYDAFMDKTVYKAKDQKDPVVIWTEGTIGAFRGVLDESIPEDPDQVLGAAEKVLQKYATLINGFEHYIGAMSIRDDLSKEEKESLRTAEELIEKYQDEQQIFMEAYDQIESGKLAGLSGSWKTVLFIMDREKILVQQAPEDSMMRQSHSQILSDKDELLASKKMKRGKEQADSPEMKRVKDAIRDMDKMLALPIQKGDKFDSARKSVIAAYKEVVDSCVAYRDMIDESRFKGRSDLGMKRRELADRLISPCFYEMKSLEKLTEKELGFENLTDTNTWADVIYGVRAIKISADSPDVSVVGAGASIIYKVTHEDGNHTYVKKTETIFNGMQDIYSTVKQYGATDDEAIQEYAAGMKQLIFGEEKLDIGSVLESIAGIYESARLKKREWHDGESEADYKKRVKAEERETVRSFIVFKLPSYIEPLREYIEKDLEGFVDFSMFYYKKSNEYANANDAADIEPGMVISDRNVSTSRLAEKLNVSDIVAKSQSVMMTNSKGQVYKANEMEGVETRDLSDLTTYCEHNKITLKYDPQVIKQLSTLQMFDFICGQVDRHTGNYNVFYEETAPGEITVRSIKAIDNDLAFGKLSYQSIVRKGKVSRLTASVFNGMVTVPFLDKAFYDQLQSLDLTAIDMLCMDQADLRTEGEIAALKDRLIGLKGDLLNLVQNGWIKLVEKPEEWADKVEELKRMKSEGRLGKGYLTESGAV